MLDNITYSKTFSQVQIRTLPPVPRYFPPFSPIFLGQFPFPVNGRLPEFNDLSTAPSLGLGSFGSILPLVPGLG